MAKYTELLAEYLEAGGALPASFEDIEGFRDLFIGEYCDKEIGFETPILFTIKLQARANLLIPPYKDRINELEAIIDKLSNPTKTHTRTGDISREYGETDETQTNTKTGQKTITGNDTTTTSAPDHTTIKNENPFDTYAESATDNISEITTVKAFENDNTTLQKNETESYSDDYADTIKTNAKTHTDKETYNNVTDTETGFTSSEALAILKGLESKVFIIKRELLREFSSLFMKVY